MTITIPVDVWFFVVPFIFFWLMSLKSSPTDKSFGWSTRDVYWVFFGPIWLAVSFASWAIWLRFFR